MRRLFTKLWYWLTDKCQKCGTERVREAGEYGHWSQDVAPTIFKWCPHCEPDKRQKLKDAGLIYD